MGCIRENVRGVDVDFLVPSRRVRLLVSDARQNIATFDAG